ncbi:alpha/beta fold hydrolase [Devosia rhodophyticola]|uniref:Alpha/beta fold hydrolase n=1 Tax=Devosia rhodophyticola TaxID=3026423 RepID=A0ABY7Z0W9_9HYPH|nr:alpha/beta fold hydrolase [Devosia rhodophyticola]WDR07047.1 alpha/beta fold hydrolase [Devosia rhodophyticola]
MTVTPLLLVPGLNCTQAVFAPLLPTLWSRGALVLTDHRRGNTIAEIAATILKDAPPRFALLGFSMGGYIALEIMRQAPERVSHLALLSTGAGSDTPEQRDNRQRQIALVRAGKFSTIAGANFANNVHPDHLNDVQLRALHLQMALDTGPDTYVRQQSAILNRPESYDLLPTIVCPTTIIVGDSDQVTPPALSDRMHALIPGSGYVLVQRAGHFALREQTVAVLGALNNWLQD